MDNSRLENSRLENSRMNHSQTMWKQSYNKNASENSRILDQRHRLPFKFSPNRPSVDSRNNSLLKKNPNDLSREEKSLNQSRSRSNTKNVNIGDRSIIKEANLADRSIIKESRPIVSALSKASMEFEDNFSAKPPSGRKGKAQDVEYLRDLKMQFMRFKEKVLKDLKRQEEELKKIIQDVYSRIRQAEKSSPNNATSAISSLPAHPASSAFNSLSVLQKSKSIVSKTSFAVAKVQVAQCSSLIDTPAYQTALEWQIKEYETLTPTIKKQVNRFNDLISNLKQQLGRPYKGDLQHR